VIQDREGRCHCVYRGYESCYHVGMALPRYIPHYTVEEHTRWEGDWELWSGVPVAMSPSADKQHQKLASELHFLLKSALKSAGCCECEVYFELDWVVSDDTIFRPDILIVCGDSPSLHLHKTPVLVAEILSPSSRQRDLIYKRESYLQLGVLYYVLVDPQRSSVEVLVSDDGQYLPASTERFALHPDCEVEIRLDGLFG
jgi:Uma2 family endonuclease